MLKLRQAIKNKIKELDLLSKDISGKGDRERLEYEKVRWLCRNDLYFLALLTNHKKLIYPFHKNLCDKISLLNWQFVRLGIMKPSEYMLDIKDIADDEKDLGKAIRLFLLFRSAFKTTIAIKLHTIQLLLNFPDLHIVISHNTQINASDILESLKFIFRTTKLAKYFPEYIPNSLEWGNKTGFSVPCRKDWNMIGDNVEAIGIGTEVTGRKFHLFKNDDVVTEASVTTEEQLIQSRDYIPMHRYLFVNPSIVIEDYCGTKYHYADAYEMLEEDPNVETIKQKLLEEDINGEYLWQEKKHKCVIPFVRQDDEDKGFTKEGILELMKDEHKFNTQNMLNPKDPKKVKFTKEMIQYFNYIPDGLNYYLVVDPADSEEKRACYTAMKVIGVDHDDNWYWVDGLFDKIDDRERIDEAIRLARKWIVFEVLWENISFGRTDNRNFERASREIPSKDRTWMVREIPASRVSKDDRILGLNDRYSRRKIFWSPKMMYYSKFEGKVIDIVQSQEYEFLGFPLVSHKDLLDAESFMLQIDLIKGDKTSMAEPSKFAHIKDPVQRGNTEVFWHNWEKWKESGFSEPQTALIEDGLD